MNKNLFNLLVHKLLTSVGHLFDEIIMSRAVDGYQLTNEFNNNFIEIVFQEMLYLKLQIINFEIEGNSRQWLQILKTDSCLQITSDLHQKRHLLISDRKFADLSDQL